MQAVLIHLCRNVGALLYGGILTFNGENVATSWCKSMVATLGHSLVINKYKMVEQ